MWKANNRISTLRSRHACPELSVHHSIGRVSDNETFWNIRELRWQSRPSRSLQSRRTQARRRSQAGRPQRQDRLPGLARPARAPSGARAPRPPWKSRSRKSTPRAASAACRSNSSATTRRRWKPKRSRSISRLVERDKVLAISGPCFSGEFETIAPQLDDRFKTVINSYCSAKPGLSDMSIWAFRNTLTSDKQLKPVVAAWLKEYKIKKVVIIYDAEDAVSKGEGAGVLPALFKAHGVEVLDIADLPHQGHRLFGAGHQGEIARRRRHRARRLLPERRRHRQGNAEAGPQRADRRRRLRRRAGLHRDRRQGGGRRLHVDRRVARRSAARRCRPTSRRS